MKFKLVTYNIWHGTFIDKAVKFLQREKPQVVCIQEIGRDGIGFSQHSINMMEQMGRELRMRGEYEEMFRGNIGKGEYGFGVAMFSTFSLEEKRVWLYEHENTQRVFEPAVQDRYYLPRRLVGIRYRELGNLWVFTTHFTITPDTKPTEHQLKQARVVKDILNNFPESIFCGDMNTVPGTDTYRWLSKNMVDVSMPETPTLHPTIHSVGSKGYHVDYLFYASDRLKHLKTTIPVVDGSDHLPVVVEFEVEG